MCLCGRACVSVVHFSAHSRVAEPILALPKKQLVDICLLQEDFLKWKGSLFFRFITALVDESKDIKHFGECYNILVDCSEDVVFITCLYFQLLNSSYDFMVVHY